MCSKISSNLALEPDWVGVNQKGIHRICSCRFITANRKIEGEKSVRFFLRIFGSARWRGFLGKRARAVTSPLDMTPSSDVKWSQCVRKTESCAPAGAGGYPRRKIAGPQEAWLMG